MQMKLNHIVTWGTNPVNGYSVLQDNVPDPKDFATETEQKAVKKHLNIWD